MSRRQSERNSRYLLDIDRELRAASAAFRDNDVEASIALAVQLWWSSGLRGRQFAQLMHQARDITQMRISIGAVEHGGPGQRLAMPYFVAVLRGLVNQARRSLTLHRASATQHGGKGRSVPFPRTPYPVPLRAPDSLILNNQKAASLFDMHRQKLLTSNRR